MVNPLKVPPWLRLQQWYPFRITPEVDLLHTYVQDMEAQVAHGVATYHAEKLTELYPDGAPQENAQVVTHHRDFNGYEWDVPRVFEIHFPNLQRSAAVITLCSFFEFELEQLCRFMHETRPSRLQLVVELQ